MSNQPSPSLVTALAPLSALSDADAAANLSAGVLTLLDTITPGYMVNDATATNALGPDLAGTLALAITAGQSNSNQSIAKICILASRLLAGGVAPSDPAVQQLGSAIVSLGILTQSQLIPLLYQTSYPAGYSPVLTADVTAARAWIAQQAVADNVRQVINGWFNSVAAELGNGTVPTAASLIASLTGDLSAGGVS